MKVGNPLRLLEFISVRLFVTQHTNWENRVRDSDEERNGYCI